MNLAARSERNPFTKAVKSLVQNGADEVWLVVHEQRGALALNEQEPP